MASLLVLICGMGIIFQVPYIRNTFYIPMCEVSNITNAEFGVLSAIYSVVSMISYLFSGWLARQIYVRKLLAISFISTGVVCVWFSTCPDYNSLKIIFALMGVTTVLPYYSGLIRAVRSLSDDSEYGSFFPIMEGGRGFISCTITFMLLYLFTALGGGRFGFSWVIRTYAILQIIIGIVIFLVLPNDEKPKEDPPPLTNQIKEIILMPKVWLICITLFSAYTIYAIMSFIPPYMVKVYGMSIKSSIRLGALRHIIQLIGGLLGGYISAKIGSKYKVILVSFLCIIVFLIGFIFISYKPNLLGICLFDFIFLGIAVYIIRGLYFAIIDESNINTSTIGAVTALVALVVYIPDVYIYIMIGSWIDKGIEGYKSMFLYGLGTSIFGVIIVLIILKILKSEEKMKNAKV